MLASLLAFNLNPPRPPKKKRTGGAGGYYRKPPPPTWLEEDAIDAFASFDPEGMQENDTYAVAWELGLDKYSSSPSLGEFVMRAYRTGYDDPAQMKMRVLMQEIDERTKVKGSMAKRVVAAAGIVYLAYRLLPWRF